MKERRGYKPPEQSIRERKWVEAASRIKIFDTLVVAKKIFDLVQPGERVLDGGCGEGRTSHRLRNEKRANVYGIDIDRRALQENALTLEQLNIKSVKLMEMNCIKTNFPDKFFDHIFLDGILGLIEPERREEVLLEMIRVLKDNGTIEITDYLQDPARKDQYEKDQPLTGEYGTFQVYDEEHNPLYQATHFSIDYVKKLLVNSGFSESSIEILTDEVTTVAVKGTSPKKRLQFTACARKHLHDKPPLDDIIHDVYLSNQPKKLP